MTISANSHSRVGVHQETLSFLKSEGLLQGTSLPFNVERKVRQGKELNAMEADILNHCVTNRLLRVIRKHGL